METLFIGTNEEYEKHVKEYHPAGAGVQSDENIRKFVYEDIEPLSDEDLKLIQRTISRNDPYTVYMQPDLSFYDEFYHSDCTEFDELFKEVKKIRRMYKRYPEYLYAEEIRDKYMNAIVDKYGGPQMFNTYYRMGVVDEWIPPVPTLSAKSPDYQYYLSGVVKFTTRDDVDVELVNEILEEALGDIEVDDIDVVKGIVTNPTQLRFINQQKNSYGSSRREDPNSINGVSVNDIINIGKMMKSWYRSDDTSEEINKSSVVPFANTPEKMEEEYFARPIIHTDLRFGEDIPEKEPDPNEMVMDPKLQRPMTRAELEKREMIRHFANYGWSELRLMRALGVGSKYEQHMMFQKQKRGRRRRKKAESFMNAVLGASTQLEPEEDTIDKLKGALFDD